MKKKLPVFLTLVLLIFTFLPLSVSADTGPKPSARVNFINMPADTVFYGTLLSAKKSNGPNAVWNGKDVDAYHKGNHDWCNLDYDTWLAFVEYEDKDGFYFLQEGWLCSESGELAWTYYPPSTFKVLLYFPKQDAFAVSDVCECYAFDSYYTVDLAGLTAGEDGTLTLLADGTQGIVAEKSYDYKWELISLICRILITLLFELGLAYAFGIFRRGVIGKLIAVNAFTQILLNILLNLVNYNQGQLAFIFYYVLFEVCAVAIEGALYSYYVKRHPELSITPRRVRLYAVIANFASLGCGMLVAKYIPGIF